MPRLTKGTMVGSAFAPAAKILQPLCTTTTVAVLALASSPLIPLQAEAVEQADNEVIEEIVVTAGSRRAERSASDIPAPVDVIPGEDFTDQATSDVPDILRSVVPSYMVNTQPISDAATIIRPANLRGLSPDNTLVLLNGKRRHRASVISFLGGGIADGAHGPDVGVFPAIGLKRVEVLRDGASSQYGSDAIAGVINFVLRDDREGGEFEVKYGSTYDGDGDNYQFSGNIGLPLGETGFLNVSGEYGETDDTIRSAQRDDVAGLLAAGNASVGDVAVNTITDEVPQIWGQPRVDDDWKIFFNSGMDISPQAEIYAFGNYAQRRVEGGFFYRNPTNRPGVFQGVLVDPQTGMADENGVPSVRVGDLSLASGGDCPAGIPLTGTNGVIPDANILASVAADPNCFSFVELYPGGFVPRFGGDTEDKSIVVGLRGELLFGTGLGYDLSYTLGNNKTEFFIFNTVNASLGPDQPAGAHFEPGAYEQTDNNFNLDLTYALPVDAFASDLSIAAGFEYREEKFEITEGDTASTQIGILAQPSAAFPVGQGFSSSSNGFGGFTVNTSDAQDNIAVYGEVEADVVEQFTLQGALRWEDYNVYGSTLDYKIGALFRATDAVSLRGTWSTGFHVPTTGQANVVNVTTAFQNGVLRDEGTFPLNSGAGQFVNDQAGGVYSLEEEQAKNLSLGVALNFGDTAVTVDYFNIKVKDRIALSSPQDFQGLLMDYAQQQGVALDGGTETSQILNALDGAGLLNAADFAGSEDLASFKFFFNDFDTRTQGVDIVASQRVSAGGGENGLALALNYTDTKVTDEGILVPHRLRQLEETIPNWKGNLSWRHLRDGWRALVRLNMHSEYYEAHLDSSDLDIVADGEITLDAEVAYTGFQNMELIVGAANLFDNMPDRNPWAGVVGSRYPATAPFGYSGGQWYVKMRYVY